MTKGCRPIPRKYLWLLALPVACLWGCGSSSIKIDSNPAGADVFVRPVGGGERRTVGKTPIPRTEMKEFQKGAPGSMMVELEKEGFLQASILVTESGNTDIEISMQLKPAVDKAATADATNLNKNMDALFEAQRLARAGRLDDSLKALDEVGKANPQWSSVPEMKGAVYFLQKDYNKALDEYRRAVMLNPENPNNNQMVKQLEGKFGAKGSASAVSASSAPTPAAAPAAGEGAGK